jgi:hypothetical protein
MALALSIVLEEANERNAKRSAKRTMTYGDRVERLLYELVTWITTLAAISVNSRSGVNEDARACPILEIARTHSLLRAAAPRECTRGAADEVMSRAVHHGEQSALSAAEEQAGVCPAPLDDATQEDEWRFLRETHLLGDRLVKSQQEASEVQPLSLGLHVERARLHEQVSVVGRLVLPRRVQVDPLTHARHRVHARFCLR